MSDASPGAAGSEDGQIHLDPTDERVVERSELSEEELEAGSDDPTAQAQVILEESEERTLDREDPPGESVEHRRSEDVVDPA